MGTVPKVISIDSNGLLRVEKLGNVVERGTNDVVKLNGRLVQKDQMRER